MRSRTSIAKILKEQMVDQEVVVKGWVRSVRNSKKFSFMVLNDGSSQESMQIVLDESLPQYETISKLLSGSSVSVTGQLVRSQGKNQGIEMQAKAVEVIGKVDENYPLQKKATSLEFLREVAHFRPRTNLFGAIFRLRHELAMATHKFFSSRGFYYLNSPIIFLQ